MARINGFKDAEDELLAKQNRFTRAEDFYRARDELGIEMEPKNGKTAYQRYRDALDEPENKKAQANKEAEQAKEEQAEKEKAEKEKAAKEKRAAAIMKTLEDSEEKPGSVQADEKKVEPTTNASVQKQQETKKANKQIKTALSSVGIQVDNLTKSQLVKLRKALYPEKK